MNKPTNAVTTHKPLNVNHFRMQGNTDNMVSSNMLALLGMSGMRKKKKEEGNGG